MQQLIIEAIARSREAGVPMVRLCAIVQRHREMRRLDAPNDPELTVRVLVNRINREDRRIADARGGDRRYRLIVYDDIAKSVRAGFAAIRERKAAGGKGWGE